MLCSVNGFWRCVFITGFNGTVELFGVGADPSDSVETGISEHMYIPTCEACIVLCHFVKT